jgi:Phosphotransferase enzyme family
MADEGTRRERQAWKQTQELLFHNADFVGKHIAPLIPEVAASSNPLPWTLEVVRNKASNRMTLRYAFGSDCEVYGKAYYDGSLGAETHRSLTHLWEHGFASPATLTVPEPLGFAPGPNLVLMRAAKGVPLSEMVLAGRMEDAIVGARLAARWLAAFQDAQIHWLPSESPCAKVEVLQLADALGKVAAERPEHSSLLIEMLHGLRAVAPKGNSLPSVVPMHGQFRPAHVFIRGEQATVIDVEKLSLSDPAKDVARFCHVLKKTCAEQAGDAERAHRVAQEFFEEYEKQRPSCLENFPYFRALLALKAFAKVLKSRKGDEHQRRLLCELHRNEFEKAAKQDHFRRIAA